MTEHQPLLPTPTPSPPYSSSSTCTNTTTSSASSSSPSQRPLSPLLGYLLVFLASLSQSLQVLFVHIGELHYGLTASLSVLTNSLIYILISFTYLTVLSKWTLFTSLPKSQLLLLFTRALCAVFAILLGSASLARIPVGTTMTLLSLAPVLSAFLAWPVLRDPVGGADMLIFAANLAGVALMSRPSVTGGRETLFGVLLAVLSAMLSSVGFVAVKTLSSSNRNNNSFGNRQGRVSFITFPLSIGITGLFLTPPVISWKQVVNLSTFGVNGFACALLGAVFGFVNQSLVNYGMQLVRPGLGLVVRTFSVPCSIMLGMIFLGEGITAMQTFGVALVVGSIAVIGTKNLKQTWRRGNS